MTERLARVSSRRPWLVVGLWLIVVFNTVVLVAMFLAFEDEAGNHEDDRVEASRQDPRPGLPQGRQRARRSPRSSSCGPRTARFGRPRRARVAALADELRFAGATRVTYYGEDRRLLSQDGDSTVLPRGARSRWGGNVDGVVSAVRRLDSEPGYRAAVTGGWTSDADEDTASLDDLKKNELFFGAPLALDRPAARLRSGRRGARSAHARARLHRRRARARGAPGAGVRPLPSSPRTC